MNCGVVRQEQVACCAAAVAVGGGGTWGRQQEEATASSAAGSASLASVARVPLRKQAFFLQTLDWKCAFFLEIRGE